MIRSRAVWLLWPLTLVFVLLFVTDAFPWLRGDVSWIPLLGRWRWPYDAPPAGRTIAPVVGVLVYVVGALALLRTPRVTARPTPVRLLLWAYGGAVLIPLLLMTVEGSPRLALFARSASPVTGGYQYAAAMDDDLGDALRDWGAFVAAYRAETQINPPGGIALSPPGLLAAYEGAGWPFDAMPGAARHFGAWVRPLQCQNLVVMRWTDAELASAWLQFLMPLWAALGVAPLYWLGTQWFDRRGARWAVALWPLVPGLAIFQPRFNVFFPLITLVMLSTLWRGLDRDRPRWIAVSGFVLSVGMLLNLSLVPLGLLAGLVILGVRLGVQRATWQRTGRDLLAFGLGSASAWLVYWALAGTDPLTLARVGFEQHTDMYRPYAPWLIMHPYDMFLFVGLPVAALAVWRVTELRRLRGRLAAATPGDVLAGAMALTLLILVLSGTARGETGRVWLFFAPVWLLLAADRLARLGRRPAMHVLVMQALVLLGMGLVLRANFTGFTAPVRVAEAAGAPTFADGSRFERAGDAVTLVGLSVDTAPEAVTLHLYWRAEGRIAHPYVLALVSVPPDGSPGSSLTWNPRGWDYPPTCWRPGQTFVDSVTVPLGEGAPSGDWLFSLSILDAFTRAPMPVMRPDGQVTDQVGIGPVRVEGPPLPAAAPAEPDDEGAAEGAGGRPLD